MESRPAPRTRLTARMMVPRANDVVAGRFRLVDLAGSGGMSAVFRAEDLELGGHVALKLSSGRPSDEHRLVREAELLEAVHSDHVVRHVAHGNDRGWAFLALEWLEGEDLGARLDRRGVTITDALTVAVQCARALDAVHSLGIVHRDVKPSNLFLVDGDPSRIKLIDFGIAKRVLSGDTANAGLVGTAHYMAPELLCGLAASKSCDVYSLGCVSYEALTGRVPHDGETLIELVGKVLGGPAVAPSRHRPSIARSVDELVLAMLGQDSELRPSVGEAVVLLERERRASVAVQRESIAPRHVRAAVMDVEQRLVTVMVVTGDADRTSDSSPSREWALEREVEAVVAPFSLRLFMSLDDSPAAVGAALVLVAADGIAGADHVMSTCSAALAIRAKIPAAKIGIATRSAIVQDGWPLGEAVAAARTLASLDDGDPMIDDATRELCGERLQVESSGGRHRLIAYDAHDLGTLEVGRCVGRDREIGELTAQLEKAVQERRPAAKLIVAPPGVGKSRLARELITVAKVRHPDVRILLGRGDPSGVASPFGIARTVLRMALGLRDRHPASAQREAVAQAIERLKLSEPERMMAALAALLGLDPTPAESDLLAAAERDATVMADAIRWAFCEWLRAEGRRHPALLLVIEGLHAGDYPSLRLLDRALGELDDTPLFVVALARPEIHDNHPRLWHERALSSHRLCELHRDHARELVESVLGAAADSELVERLVARGEGNAFCLEQLARAAADGAEEVPESVLAVAQARFFRLDARERQLLRAASVFGDKVVPAAIVALLGPWNAAVLESIPLLVDAQILSRSSDATSPAESSYAFRHSLLREAAYATLTADDRRIAHRLAAEWLESSGYAVPLVLADHWMKGDQQARAIDWLERGAKQALSGHDFRGAIGSAERAAACGAEGEQLGRLMLIAAEAHEWATDTEATAQAGRAALALLPAGSAAWFKAFEHTLIALVRLHGATSVADLCGELDRLPADRAPSDEEIVAMARVAGQLMIAGDAAGRSWLDRAEAACQRIESLSAHVIGWISWARSWRAMAEGHVGLSLRHDMTSARAFDAAGDVRQSCYASANVGYGQMRLGLLEEAESSLRHALAVASRLGLTLMAGTAAHNLGLTLALLGGLEEARELERRAIALLQGPKVVRILAAAHEYLARIHLMANEIEQSERCAREGVALAERWDDLRAIAEATLSRALVAKGEAREALQWASKAAAILGDGHADAEDSYIRWAYLDALLANGDESKARAEAIAARDKLEAGLTGIDDERTRRTYLTRIPEHVGVLAICDSLGIGSR